MSQRLKFVTFGAMLFIAGMVLISPIMAHAQATPTPANICTDFAKLNAGDPNEPKLLTDIVNYIKQTIGVASQNLFQAFTSSAAYQNAVGGAMTLVVVFLGVGFLMGVVQASFGQLVKIVLKMAFVIAVISPTGWNFFTNTVVTFFNDGTDQIIAKVMEIGTGVPIAPGSSPFASLDHIAYVMLSPDIIIAILASLGNTGPYGMLYGALLSWSMWILIKMLIRALETYALAFLVRALMFGVAPIFVVFLLFERTKQLFMGWVNMLVVLSLKPILYFTFISFFMVMITSSMTNIMGGSEVCWVEYKQNVGGTNKTAFWRFKLKGNQYAQTDNYDYRGPLSCVIGGRTDCMKDFPINIVDLLTFIIIVYIASMFGSVVDSMAQEISNASANLDVMQRKELPALNNEGPKTAGPNESQGGVKRK